ncbi:AEC family transporter, partial [Azotobacter chroococcum]|nr:AEC family transporter [Azotobacter chroococcum]
LFMPMLLFSGIAKAALEEGFSPALLLAYFVPALGIFAAVNLLGHRLRGRPTPFGLTAGFSNNVLVGIPLVASLFGSPGLVYVFTVLAFHSLLLFSFQSLYGALAAQEAVNVRSLLLNLANPMIVGLLLGVLLNLSGLQLPAPLEHLTQWLAQAALPCALIVLGVNLSNYRLRPSREALGIVFAKLLVFPLAVLALCAGLGLGPLASSVLTAMAACPSGVNVFGFVRHPEDSGVVSSAITLSTLLAVLTLPLWVFLSGHL